MHLSASNLQTAWKRYPLTVETLSRTNALFANKAANSCCRQMKLGSTTLSLRVGPTKSPNPAGAKAIRLLAGFGAMEIANGLDFIRLFSGLDISPGDLDEELQGSWLQRHIIGHLQESPFASVHTLTAIQDGGNVTQRCMDLSWAGDGHSFITRAIASEESWLGFLSGREWQSHTAHNVNIEKITVPVDVFLGSHTIQGARMAGLQGGDILLPAQSCFSVSGTGYLRCGNLILQVEFDSPQVMHIIKVEKQMNQQEPAEETGNVLVERKAQDQLIDAATSETCISLDEMPVRLDFRLGSCQLELASLRNVNSNSILLLEDGNAGAIQIMAGKRVLGIGEAVDVDGQLGVRITTWGRS